MPEITTQVSPLQQVFLNLLTNAIKYSDKDEISIGVNSQVLNENFVEFSVSDNGPGIDPKFHERIFQMFQTLQSRDVIESSGMGLAIIKKVIEGQGGEIRVESALGEGAVFTFSWPINNTNNSEVI
jgi:signal transduction histidine kinase